MKNVGMAEAAGARTHLAHVLISQVIPWALTSGLDHHLSDAGGTQRTPAVSHPEQQNGRQPVGGASSPGPAAVAPVGFLHVAESIPTFLAPGEVSAVVLQPAIGLAVPGTQPVGILNTTCAAEGQMSRRAHTTAPFRWASAH